MTYLAAFFAALELVTLSYVPIMNFAALVSLITLCVVDAAAMLYPCDDPECAICGGSHEH